MLTTPRWGLRYPEGTGDLPDVPLWMEHLASDLDDVAKDDQGTLASRPVSTVGTPGKRGRYYWATNTGQLFRDHGTGWTELAAKPEYVTSLPGSPVDGQEVFYAADAANGVIWHLRYRVGASGSYKWEPVGGSPLYARVDTIQAQGSTGHPVTYDLTTVGPAVVVPLAGDYGVSYGAVAYVHTGSNYAYVAVSPGPSFADALQFSSASYQSNAHRTQRLAVAAGATVKLTYPSDTLTGATYQKRWIEVTPQRVG